MRARLVERILQLCHVRRHGGALPSIPEQIIPVPALGILPRNEGMYFAGHE